MQIHNKFLFINGSKDVGVVARDISVKEQMTMMLRYVDDKGHVIERFPIFHYRCIKNDVAMRVGFLALLENVEHRFVIPKVSKVCEYADVF
ncbi:unnamed protein product [Prunus brigantina]